jgi:hemerythrin superfamily protein
MKATKFLEQQHREVEALFKQLDKAKSAGPRRMLFDKIADALAIHATIEERHFYPAVQDKATEGTLLESLEEHLAIKRVIADLLDLEADDPIFMAKAKVLKDEIEHHVQEEETGLFPKVERLFDEETLEALAEEMEDAANELQEDGNPRAAIPSETEYAAPL